jgi:glycosyltransferase involved in cell wall biosynthesis
MREALRAASDLLVAPELLETCYFHFLLTGKFARIKVDNAVDLFHASHPVALYTQGRPNVYTIHDLVPLRLPNATLEDKRYYYNLVRRIANTADHIVTVSEHSRRDIMEFLHVSEERITNTYQAVDIPSDLLDTTDDEVADEVFRLFDLEFGRYFLFYGAIEPKKNVSRIVDAYTSAGSRLPLIIVGGSGWQNTVERRKIRDRRFSSYVFRDGEFRERRRVRWFPYLPRNELISLIRGARAVIFPSIYEGFGLPVAEAMLLGTPVITSNITSLPEVAGEAALLVNPHSTRDIARAIATLDTDDQAVGELRVKGREQAKKFSPRAYERKIKELYAQIL